jgi:putative membrane protein
MLKLIISGCACVAVVVAMTVLTFQIPSFADDKATGGQLSKGDLSFLTVAAAGGMMEVKAGQLAADKATSPDVKAFGQKMVEDHGKANDELMAFAKGKGVTMPADLETKHQKMLDKLASQSGADFDKQYVKQMVEDHKDDVNKFKKFAERGDDTALKGWAAKTLPVLEQHYAMIKNIDAKMNGKHAADHAADHGADHGAGHCYARARGLPRARATARGSHSWLEPSSARSCAHDDRARQCVISFDRRTRDPRRMRGRPAPREGALDHRRIHSRPRRCRCDGLGHRQDHPRRRRRSLPDAQRLQAADRNGSPASGGSGAIRT